MSDLVYTPGKETIENSKMFEFQKLVERKYSKKFSNYNEFHGWSVKNKEDFWSEIWDFCGVIGEKGSKVLEKTGEEFYDNKWFTDSKLNFAENLLGEGGDKEAIVFYSEKAFKADKFPVSRINRTDLKSQVAKIQHFLKGEGLEVGDRVAGFMPNMIETISSFLACSSMGAIWSSCSTDFGAQGALDRFGQIEPSVLITVNGYYYNGKAIDISDKVQTLLDNIPSIKKVVVVDYCNETELKIDSDKIVSFNDIISSVGPETPEYTRLPFDHPLAILYSSGTTGAPKCIVHGAGGTLLQHLKELSLHADITEGSRMFYYTTCGWMMWNWMVSALALDATLVLYDGSPFHPKKGILFDLIEKEEVSVFGTSAKYLFALEKMGVKPKNRYKYPNLKAILSTGSPLSPESYEYVYQEISNKICLSSISGGTDIVSCFALGNPCLEVRKGELQCRGLGMDVRVLNDSGESVVDQIGELVCTSPFPSMPIYFWNDKNNEKYRAAYFEEIPGIWCHGDWVKLTEHGSMIFYGRSDAVLNPSGVRIGTAEIYRQVEKLGEIKECVAVGQNIDNDERVILFVIMQEEGSLDDDNIKKIKTHIRANLTPRHVPAKILEVTDIPRTVSGKITEVAIKKTIHGMDVKNLNTLANPDSLEQFKNRQELNT